MYKDLREFIELVDKLGALRRGRTAPTRASEIGGITSRGRLPDCPALLFDRHQRPFARLSRLHPMPPPMCKRRNLAASGLIRAATCSTRSKPGWRSARILRRSAGYRQNRRVLDNTIAGRDVDYRHVFPAPSLASATTADRSSARFAGHHARSRLWLDHASIYRVQVHARTKSRWQFDHGRPAWRHHRQKYWDRGENCPVAIVHGEDPALFIAGFGILAPTAARNTNRRLDQGRADRSFRRPANRPADSRLGGNHFRRRCCR